MDHERGRAARRRKFLRHRRHQRPHHPGGGTRADPQAKTWPSALLTLSARSQESLDTLTAQLGARLEGDSQLDLFDAAYTLQVGRKHFPFRRAVVAANKADAIALLQSQKAPSRQWDGTVRPVVFMFSGQGSQHRGMGQRLYAADPTFRSAFDTCAEILKPLLNVDLREVLYGSDITAESLAETRLAQPALFAVEYALARMWMSWGVTPAAMIGHSIGEYAAACISGVFPLEDALKVVAIRGSLMQDMPRGGMLAVAMPEERLRVLMLGRNRARRDQCAESMHVGGSRRRNRHFTGQNRSPGDKLPPDQHLSRISFGRRWTASSNPLPRFCAVFASARRRFPLSPI